MKMPLFQVIDRDNPPSKPRVSPAISRPLMKKRILIAATAALLALPNLSSTVLAAPPDASEDAGPHHPKFSAEDFAAFADARIAALKAGLRLTCRPAITLRAMALRQVGTRSPTACNASGRTIRGAERILGQTAIAIHALELRRTSPSPALPRPCLIRGPSRSRASDVTRFVDPGGAIA
jgi:hypothetical protein